MSRFIVWTVLGAALSCAAGVCAAQEQKAYQCRRATGEIAIDGVADEKDWKGAAELADFRAHWADHTPDMPTNARLLWDDDALYFTADMQDRDLYADVVEQDGMTWFNDVFELFFKPSADRRGYYEFQVNAANTRMDMYLPSRGSGGYGRWAKEIPFHMESAVVLRGSLNEWQDQDQGWTVEGRIPWDDFSHTGGRPRPNDEWFFTLCRYDYSTELERPDLSATAPLTQGDFHRYEDYAPLRFVAD